MEYSFEEFYAIWCKIQGWEIPAVHLRIIQFLEDEDWKMSSKILLIWRSVGKSTLLDLWISFKLSIDPTLRFLVMSADKETATKTTKDIRGIIRIHPLCSHLLSRKLEERQDRLYVRGHNDRRNPSVVAWGIGSNVTGGRCDYLIFDDVEVPRNSGVESKRKELRGRIAEASKLLDKKKAGTGRRLFIGTYHDEISIYDEERDCGGSTLRVPLLRDTKGTYPHITGKSNWEELFGPERIIELQNVICKSAAEWLSQYMLVPKSLKDSYLDPDLLIVYDGEVEFREVNDTVAATILMADGKKVELTNVNAHWDPSSGKKGRDDSVLSIVFGDAKGNTYIHRTIAMDTPDPEIACRRVKQELLRFNIPSVSVETNGVGAFLPRLLINELDKTGIGVTERYETKEKWKRIIEAYETRLFGHRIYVSAQVFSSKFYGQMRDFSPDNRNMKDDFIDSPASAIKAAPIRIASISHLGGKQVTHWGGTGTCDLQLEPLVF